MGIYAYYKIKFLNNSNRNSPHTSIGLLIHKCKLTLFYSEILS